MKPPATRALAVVAVTAAAALAAAPSAAAEQIEGIDVSNHQDRIAWDRVPDEYEFAFLKATEGTTFVDAWYDRNRTLATDTGRVAGAYHFARPDGNSRSAARRDGRAEAAFFDRVADPQRGELRPVLDLEVTGDLPPDRLISWARAFVKELEERVGAKPMIYTSPVFWRTAMDDTQWFAERGYNALWIAHWETKRPDVPADNWDGESWTFWQYTSCGYVTGIEGCVDLNRYRHDDLGRATLGGADAEPPDLIQEPLPLPPRVPADPQCGGKVAGIVAVPGEDSVRGTPEADVIVGSRGDDTIKGRGGDDVVCARGGDDVLGGNSGADDLRGGPGDDLVRGHRDDDQLRGNGGADELRGNDGDDGLRGGADADVLKGGAGADDLRGGGGSDDCRGGPDRDAKGGC